MPNRKVAIAGAAFIFTYLLLSENRKKRRWWKTNLYDRRFSLLLELKSQEISGQYKNITRMSPMDFEYLLNLIGPKISRQDTLMSCAISPQDRLAVTLRYLSTGDSYTSLQYTFRISKQSISCIVPEVCEAITEALKENIKVAWMHYEQSAILTVHNHVITRNPRISVTHDKHRTWFLHISNVQEEDKGRYMCQINTANAKTQFGYLYVVVPPNIDDSLSSSDVIVREGANETLTCKATGYPKPSVKWKRDDNSKITINKTLSVTEWEGEILELTQISRLDMGAYLCIASNSIPPSISKRIKLSVDFPPMLWIPHQLVGAPLAYSVTLECFTEAHPGSLNYWTREDGQMIHESRKYHTENILGNPSYKTHMRLTINDIQQNDYGTYKCMAKNPRGETDGSIRLYISSPPTTSAKSTTAETPEKIKHLWGNSRLNTSLLSNLSSLTHILIEGPRKPHILDGKKNSEQEFADAKMKNDVLGDITTKSSSSKVFNKDWMWLLKMAIVYNIVR